MIKHIGCAGKYFNIGNISFTQDLVNDIDNGRITQIVVINNDNGEEHPEPVDARMVAENRYEPYRGAGYFVSQFRTLKKVDLVFTQSQLSERWKIRACRFSEVARAELLVPDGKIGRTLTYSTKCIEEAMKNVYFVAWLKNTQTVDSCS